MIKKGPWPYLDKHRLGRDDWLPSQSLSSQSSGCHVGLFFYFIPFYRSEYKSRSLLCFFSINTNNPPSLPQLSIALFLVSCEDSPSHYLQQYNRKTTVSYLPFASLSFSASLELFCSNSAWRPWSINNLFTCFQHLLQYLFFISIAFFFTIKHSASSANLVF